VQTGTVAIKPWLSVWLNLAVETFWFHFRSGCLHSYMEPFSLDCVQNVDLCISALLIHGLCSYLFPDKSRSWLY
jgi:hypothetical protein